MPRAWRCASRLETRFALQLEHSRFLATRSFQAKFLYAWKGLNHLKPDDRSWNPRRACECLEVARSRRCSTRNHDPLLSLRPPPRNVLFGWNFTLEAAAGAAFSQKGLFGWLKLYLEGLDNSPSYFVLELENVGEVAIIAFRPQVTAGSCVDEPTARRRQAPAGRSAGPRRTATPRRTDTYRNPRRRACGCAAPTPAARRGAQARQTATKSRAASRSHSLSSLRAKSEAEIAGVKRS